MNPEKICFFCSNECNSNYWASVHGNGACFTCMNRLSNKYRGILAPFCDYCEEEFAVKLFIDCFLCEPCAGTISLGSVWQKIAERGLSGRSDL